MALSKLTYNSLNVTAAASKGIGFDSDPDALQADYTGGDMVVIKKLTASSSATLSFVDGTSDVVLDNTYKEYLFTFKDIHPATDDVEFRIKFSIDGGSNYNATVTSTVFYARHYEDDTTAALGYHTSMDEAQGTSGQQLSRSIGNGNDETFCGTVHLFSPSSTTFVKHFISRGHEYTSVNNEARDYFVSGYVNSTSAVDAIQFAMSTGNIDAGDICLYGIN